jgi:phage terminase small subunit
MPRGGSLRKPTALKLLEGTARPDRLNPNEPEFDLASGSPPSWLPKKAKEVWQERAVVLLERKVLTEADVELFAKYCIIAAKTRLMAKATKTDKVRQFLQLAQQERLLAIEFGLTPASRGRVSGDNSKPPKNPWEKFTK